MDDFHRADAFSQSPLFRDQEILRGHSAVQRKAYVPVTRNAREGRREPGETLAKKVTTMKKLQMLTAAGGILLALAGPTLAAQRAHRAVDAYASAVTDRSGAYYYGPNEARDARAQAPVTGWVRDGYAPNAAGRNQPYPDRPYGDPDSW